MKPTSPPIFVLGGGPVVRVLSSVLSAGQIGRRTDGHGWAWPKPDRNRGNDLEAVKLILVTGGSGEARWIRWHREARECPFARKVGVLLFGMEEDVATNLTERDVFGRSVATDSQFGSWSDDLAILSSRHSLQDLMMALAHLGCLFRTSWDRDFSAASCLPRLIDAIQNRSMAYLAKHLEAAIATDWDATCFSGTQFGNSHAWANRIRGWLAGVTAGVTPDWEEGFMLFTPLLSRQTPT